MYFKYIGINQTFPFCFNYFGRQQNLILNPQYVELGQALAQQTSGMLPCVSPSDLMFDKNSVRTTVNQLQIYMLEAMRAVLSNLDEVPRITQRILGTRD